MLFSESGTPVFSDVVGKSKTSILVSSLTPNTQYGIKISYVNNKGPGPYSDLYNVRTNQDGKTSQPYSSIVS